MRSSSRLQKTDEESRKNRCIDSKNCTCVLCYFKYVHRMWFSSQRRLLVMHSPKDREIFTKSILNKFASCAEEAAACRNKFLIAHDIVYNDNKTQKRMDWSVNGSRARKFGNIEDLIFMWYNMDMTLPEESYKHATLCPPARHHPLRIYRNPCE